MKKAVIFHGTTSESEYNDKEYPSASNSHWIPWLQKQLMIHGWHAYAPEIPLPYAPAYQHWLTELNRYDINEDTMLVGHSRGGAFLLRYLSDNPDVKAGKVALVAPSYVRPPGDTSDFYDYTIDPSLVSRTLSVTLFTSSDDKDYSVESAKKIQHLVRNIKITRFEDKGHFTKQSLGTDEFPELLEELLK